MDKSVIEALIKNSPLALVVIGLFLFLIGAAGGWPKPALQINELYWRIALAVIGGVVSSLGGLLIWRAKSDEESSASAEKYGIQIVYPGDLAKIGNEVEVSGTYKVKPRDKSVVLIEIHPDTQHCWFKRSATFDEARKHWYAKVYIGASSGEMRIIMVGIMGKAGQALSDYFHKVGERTKQWPSVETLTPDIVECDRVKVIRK